MEKHVTLLGVLYIAMSAFLVAIAIVVYFVVAGAGIFTGEIETIAITSGVASAVGLFLVLLALPGILGGIGLIKHKEWARILVLVLAFFNLINIPFGTIMKDDTIQLFFYR